MTATAGDSRSIIAAIAAELAISPRTVLRVLAQPATRDPRPSIRRRAEAVRRRAAELGYRPSTLARCARRRQLPLVALLQRQESEFLPTQLVRGLAEALRASDRELVVSLVDERDLLVAEAGPRLLRESLVGGIVMHQAWQVDASERAALAGSAVPVVWANAAHGAGCVHPDESGGIAELTRRAIALGHRRIAWFACQVEWGGPAERHFSRDARLHGYVEAMRTAGLEPVVHEISWPAVGGRSPWGSPADDRIRHASSLLRAVLRPTAVICPGADSAGPVISAALACGIDVPAGLSVCCVDAEAFPVSGLVPMTGILPLFACGVACVEVLDRGGAARVRRPRIIPFSEFRGNTLVEPPAG